MKSTLYVGIPVGILTAIVGACGAGSISQTPPADASSSGGFGGAQASGGSANGGADVGTGGALGLGGAKFGAGGVSSTGGATNTGGTTSDGGSKGAGGSSSGGGTGKLLFVGDFETGDLSQWNYIERCAADRVTVYSSSNLPSGAPAPREGKYAVHVHVLDSDVAPCTSTDNPRAEMDTVETLFKPGDEAWEFWSIYVPDTHPQPKCGTCSSGAWFAFQEDYGAPWDGSPSIGWFFDFVDSPNHFTMDRGDQYGHDQPWIGAMVTGSWVDFLVHKKFANADDGSGFVEAWVNGSPITFSTCNCARLSTQTMHSTQKSLGFYLTAYRAAGLFDSFDVYYDAVRIGTTRDAVELPRP